jgi:hypothetical protein
MQTFLPYQDFTKSAECLDYKRLGKQRVEAFQIFNAIEKKKTEIKVSWGNHPAVLMWEGYEEALKEYTNVMITTWIGKGYNNSMQLYILSTNITYPPWLGIEEFHASHRSNLLRKDKLFYSQYNWAEPDNLEYVWPVQKGSI